MMRLNLPVVVAAAFLLAACSTASDEGAGSGSSGNAAATTSGSDTNVATTTPGAKPGSQLDLEINVGDRVLFGFDKSTLTAEGRTTVERWGAWLATYPANKIMIEGHADERGTREYNLALGERRANASREYLVSLGIDPNRVKTISYGKERPAIPGSNENAYAQNRRSVVALAK
jgi:peptidoglycan-associated lipoprotein